MARGCRGGPARSGERGAAMARSLGGWLLGGCLLVAALGMVPPPENVRMNSVNFKNILQWESPAFPKENLTYTAQYQSYRGFQDTCKSTALTECDFSSLSKYGDHTLRVRTESADEHSDWVNITFCPVDDTVIGPPGMQVETLADSLYMHFSAPKIENEPETWTMKNIYNSWTYNVQYWKNGTDKKFQVTSQYDFEAVRNLEPWTTYCVQVQGFLPDRNKSGGWSQPVCEQTADDEMTPSWIVAVVLIASVLLVCLLLLGCFALIWCIYKKTKYAFAPGSSLPQHLKEFLSHPHHSTLLIFNFPSSEENEVFDKLSVVTEHFESSEHNPGNGCSFRNPTQQGSPEPVPGGETPFHGHTDPDIPTPAPEDDQSLTQGPGPPVQSQVQSPEAPDSAAQPQGYVLKHGSAHKKTPSWEVAALERRL